MKTFPSCNYLFDTAIKRILLGTYMSVKLAPKMSSSYNQVNSYDPDESDSHQLSTKQSRYLVDTYTIILV